MDNILNLKCTPEKLARSFIKRAASDIESGDKTKINAVWVETSGCFGEIISMLDSESPDIIYFLKNIVNLEFLGSINGDDGEAAYERILNMLNTEYIFIICGAIPKRDNGLFTRVATYKAKEITASEITTMLAKSAKHIVALGTCAAYGGPTAAKPNVSEAVSVPDFLQRKDVIRIPGCPANPVWTMGIISYLVSYGVPELDSEGRPVAYYGRFIHDVCERRGFFDNGIFAKKLGDPECMFMLGCKGPITKAYCPISRWNQTQYWPIGVNTPCIGCAGEGFPDKSSPFVHYGGSI